MQLAEPQLTRPMTPVEEYLDIDNDDNIVHENDSGDLLTYCRIISTITKYNSLNTPLYLLIYRQYIAWPSITSRKFC